MREAVRVAASDEEGQAARGWTARHVAVVPQRQPIQHRKNDMGGVARRNRDVAGAAAQVQGYADRELPIGLKPPVPVQRDFQKECDLSHAAAMVLGDR